MSKNLRTRWRAPIFIRSDNNEIHRLKNQVEILSDRIDFLEKKLIEFKIESLKIELDHHIRKDLTS